MRGYENNEVNNGITTTEPVAFTNGAQLDNDCRPARHQTGSLCRQKPRAAAPSKYRRAMRS